MASPSAPTADAPAPRERPVLDPDPDSPASANRDAGAGDPPHDPEALPPLSGRQIGLLLISVLLISICGLIYELLIGTLSSYLLGSSVTHFSITIGLFLSAMGIGSWLSRFVRRRVLRTFVAVEIATGLLGGLCPGFLYLVYANSDYFYPAMVASILAIGGCIGLEIPLLARLCAASGPLRENLANIFSVDYIGALAGSLLFPLVLLPHLGVLGTGFVTGLLNLAVAAVILYEFRGHTRHRSDLILVTGLGILVLAGGLVSSTRLSDILERQLYQDTILYTAQTPYQRIVITRRGADVRLFLDGSLQFSLVDEYRYHEALAHPAMTLAHQPRRVLVLGGGDGLLVRELLKYPALEAVTVVDIDPAITQLARTHHALRDANGDSFHDPRVTVVNADAFTWIRANDGLYNVILSDLPDPHGDALAKLYSTAFYTMLAQRLAPGGVIAVQSTSPFFARPVFWCIAETLDKAGLHTLPYHTYVPSFGDWGFVIATAGPLDPSRYAPAPELGLRYFTAPVFQAGLAFPPDTGPMPSEPNTLDHPIILSLYEQSWKEWR